MLLDTILGFKDSAGYLPNPNTFKAIHTIGDANIQPFSLRFQTKTAAVPPLSTKLRLKFESLRRHEFLAAMSYQAGDSGRWPQGYEKLNLD